MSLIRLALFVLLSLVMLLAGCDRFPDSYPPPRQRQPVEAFSPGPEAMMVEMSEGDANLHILKDIYNPGSAPWRWSEQSPTVRILPIASDKLNFRTDFAIWADSFKITGPVEITFLVNNRPLDKIRYTTPGEKHFNEPVPDGWLTPDAEATLALFIDKLYISPTDGKRFGVILVRMGLTK